MHKAKLGRKYVNLMTGSYLPFILFVTLFVSMIMWLASTISLDVMKTYSGSIINRDDKSFIIIKAEIAPLISELYVYMDRNSNVYKMKPVHVSYNGTMSYIELGNNKVLSELSDEFAGGYSSLQVEVFIGKTTLLKRILPLGETEQ